MFLFIPALTADRRMLVESALYSGSGNPVLDAYYDQARATFNIECLQPVEPLFEADRAELEAICAACKDAPMFSAQETRYRMACWILKHKYSEENWPFDAP